MSNRIVLTLCLLVATSPLCPAGAEPAADKSAFTAFNPTPRELWRELSADRPDFTESPVTVDAGVRQVELSFFDFTRAGDDETIALMPVNLKIGLRHNMDLQVVLTPYVREDIAGTAGTGGLGDTELRLKYNFWGNDSGETALGVMPFIKLPTATNDLGNGKIEGGLILPFALELSPKVGMGLMLEVDAVYDEEDDHYDAEWIATGVLGFDAREHLGLYIEGIGVLPAGGGSMQGILGLGATYAVSADASLDIGCNIGLTDDTDDINLFGGLTFRF